MGNNTCSQMCAGATQINSRGSTSNELKIRSDLSLGMHHTAAETLLVLGEQARKSMTQLNNKSKSPTTPKKERVLTCEQNHAKDKTSLAHIGSISEMESNFKNSDGYVVVVSKDGGKYIGSWKDGEKHGFGEEEWPDKSKFVGNYSGNTKNGYGKQTWPDGSFYEGNWKAGLKDGKGRQVYPDGYEYDGQWKAGKKDGYGVFKNSKGEVFSGEFKDNLPNGAGTYTNMYGVNLRGFWIKGKFENEQESPAALFDVDKAELFEYLFRLSRKF